MGGVRPNGCSGTVLTLCTVSHKAGIHSKQASQYSFNKIRSIQTIYRTRPSFIAKKCYIEWYSIAEEAVLIHLILTACWNFLGTLHVPKPFKQTKLTYELCYFYLLTKMSSPLLCKKKKKRVKGYISKNHLQIIKNCLSYHILKGTEYHTVRARRFGVTLLRILHACMTGWFVETLFFLFSPFF